MVCILHLFVEETVIFVPTRFLNIKTLLGLRGQRKSLNLLSCKYFVRGHIMIFMFQGVLKLSEFEFGLF